MDTHPLDELASGGTPRAFVRRVLEDMRALELMIAAGTIETGIRRMGAEQEVFLIDPSGAPAPVALEVISRLQDPHFATELALFNLEINVAPVLLEDDCLSGMAATLESLLARVVDAARAEGADAVLAGILPTLRASDLVAKNLTPRPRYREMDRAVSAGHGPFQIHIRALDELRLTRESLIVESGNCSFQVHLQVGPDEFPQIYNAAQAFAAPVLAAATNSPLLLGKRLWHETRIALFQQAADMRGPETGRTIVPRVTFGRRWVESSVLEIYREDIARYRPILHDEDDAERPIAVLERGGIPNLSALRLHNGTVWRWNRPCYGLTDGRPHLRIENRVLPSGPTIEDQIGNAALWLGLMRSAIGRDLDVTRRMDFEAAHGNFIAAARLGLDAQLHWFDGRTVPADRLLLDELIPFAYDGLRTAGVSSADVDRFLGVVARRVATRRTGSRWALDSLRAMEAAPCSGTAGQRLSALTLSMRREQRCGSPVHEWPLARVEDAGASPERAAPVEQYMTTEVFTVRPDDPIELAAHLMELRGTPQVPVEDEDNLLVGMVSYPAILRLVAWGGLPTVDARLPVSSIMSRDPLTVVPETPTVDAIEMMVKHGLSGLPVVRDGRLVGVVWQRALLRIARELLLEQLRGTVAAAPRRRRSRLNPSDRSTSDHA
jgi:CBS domain-containing protein